MFFFIIQFISPTLRGCSVGVRQLDLRFRADKNSTRPNCICVGLRTSVTLKMSKLVDAKDWRNYSCLVTKWEWLGVSMRRFDESAITAVNGREFIAYSTRQKGVFKTSSVRWRVLRMVESAHSKLWKSLSQMQHWFRDKSRIIILPNLSTDTRAWDKLLHSRYTGTAVHERTTGQNWYENFSFGRSAKIDWNIAARNLHGICT